MTQTIHQTVHLSQQSWIYESIVKSKRTKYRVYIVRNAYDMQSYAKVQHWTNEQWIDVLPKVPINSLECKSISYVDSTPNQKLFENDAKMLLKKALAICED